MPKLKDKSEDQFGRPSFTIFIRGKALDSKFQPMDIIVHKEINRIAYTRLILADGIPAESDFPASKSREFTPGNELEIKAGYEGEEETIFKGTLLSQKIKFSSGMSCLWVEARDKAFKMTLTPKNKLFTDVKDSDIAQKLIDQYGLSGKPESTTVKHKEMVQYQCTDWDFLLSRMEANAKLVFISDGNLDIRKVNLSKGPVLTLTYGNDIIDLEAEIDARHQVTGLKTRSWDYSVQKIVEQESSEPAEYGQGDLKAKFLASKGDAERGLYDHGGKLDDGEQKAWADSILVKKRMSMIRGRVSCKGNSDVLPGNIIELKGLGDHFTGKVYVSAVRHEFYRGNWTTDIQFGLDPQWFLAKNGPNGKDRCRLVASIKGLRAAKVLKLSQDPDSEDRIMINLPMIHGEGEGIWARMATLDAGENRGSFFRPEVDDEVIVGFIDADPRFAVILGMLNSSAKPAPVTPENEDNNIKGFYTRSKMEISFDDEKKIMTLKTPEGNTLAMDEEDKSILLQDQNNNKIKMDNGGIIIDSSKDIILKAPGKIQLSATGDCKLEGLNIKLSANTRFEAKANAGLEVSTSAIAVLKGSLVQIN